MPIIEMKRPRESILLIQHENGDHKKIEDGERIAVVDSEKNFLSETETIARLVELGVLGMKAGGDVEALSSYFRGVNGIGNVKITNPLDLAFLKNDVESLKSLAASAKLAIGDLYLLPVIREKFIMGIEMLFSSAEALDFQDQRKNIINVNDLKDWLEMAEKTAALLGTDIGLFYSQHPDIKQQLIQAIKIDLPTVKDFLSHGSFDSLAIVGELYLKRIEFFAARAGDTPYRREISLIQDCYSQLKKATWYASNDNLQERDKALDEAQLAADALGISIFKIKESILKIKYDPTRLPPIWP